MRLFSRKSKAATSSSGNAPANTSSGSLQSPVASNGAASSAASFKAPPLPDIPLPKAPDPTLDPAAYLRSIYAVRDRSRFVLDKAKKNQLKHFTVDMSKFAETASYVVSIIKVRRQSRNRTTR